MSRLLQSLDADGVHSNGIEIDDATRAQIADAIAARVTLNFARVPDAFADDAKGFQEKVAGELEVFS